MRTALQRRTRHRVAAAVAPLVALLSAGACGTSSESDYPAVTGNYGASIGGSLGAGGASRRWIAAEGTSRAEVCTALISIPTQNGPAFSGTVLRYDPCRDEATFQGEVAHDGSVRIVLTQQRWAACTAAAPVEYTGYIRKGGLYATARVAVQCDDGTAMTVEEILSGSLPAPPSTQ